MKKLDLETLLSACDDHSFDDGIRIETELEPLAGHGAPVKPAVYEGGRYQQDRRWASSEDREASDVIVVDNVPSQANRLEAALQSHRQETGVPEMVLDLSGLTGLPAHLPRRLSSLQFPHRNADAYLRDSRLGDQDFVKTDLGKAILNATPWDCGALVAWFPQALLYGFWQSHLGKKAQQTKHARAWVSEIIGWNPASTETKTMGLKGDALNLNVDDGITVDDSDQTQWGIVNGKAGGRKKKLSDIGHGQVPFMGDDATAAAVSFERVTQRATVSFAQLRRVSTSDLGADANAAVRALLVALGLHAHALAFARGFALRSGAELRPRKSSASWLGAAGDGELDLGDRNASAVLLEAALAAAGSAGVPLEGWKKDPLVLTPKDNLAKVVRKTWPEVSG